MAKKLTLGEIDKVEEIMGCTMDTEPRPVGKFLIGMVYVLKRREDPAFGLADAYDMDAEEAQAFIEETVGELEDPKA